jgi:catechol 2,3-dioxygenase-like lactoylglutathione lyase family enzyme
MVDDGRDVTWKSGSSRSSTRSAAVVAWHGDRMVHLGVVVLGVDNVERAAEFWCDALGYERRQDGFGGWSMVLVPRSGAGANLALQTSETTPEEYPRIHLDLHVASATEQALEVERLVSLGAERVDWDRYPEDPDFVVLADPEGNRFCVVDLSHEYS